MTRKVMIVTGTRAEWGLLRGVAAQVKVCENCELVLVACAAHLSPRHGLTITEISADGFAIDAQVAMLDEKGHDSPAAITAAIARGLKGFAAVYSEHAPDIVVVLGDRYEILAAATAALMARVPVAHIHGGELSEGAVDDAIRHAVSKMSHLHFVAAEDYRARVIQMGEDPARVFNVGALGVENALNAALIDRAQLERDLGVALDQRTLVVTFHPVTLCEDDGLAQIDALLGALADLGADTPLLFTMPNADAGGAALRKRIERFVAARPNAVAHSSLGQLRYLSALAYCGGVVGNSSSGLIEAPSLGIGTVNIGDRQAGRLRAPSVIDCASERAAISAALRKVVSPAFRHIAQARANPYGSGETAREIARVLADHPLEGLVRKRFHDLPGATA